MKGALRAILWGMFPFAAMATEQDSELVQVGGDKFLRWYGHEGRTYFLQIADPNDPLNKWVWAPVIESGNDEEISYEVDGTANKAFYRLQFTDIETTDPDNDDFDWDGITNLVEITTYQTNPLSIDTDGDGLPDDWEINFELDPNDDGSEDPFNGADGDADGDGLTNIFEFAYFGDPDDLDTDDDGLNDYQEAMVHQTLLDHPDFDNDGLNDLEEITAQSDPFDWDSDNDTIDDGSEVNIHLTSPIKMDTDGDWMWDDWELANSLDPTDAADGLDDADGDTLKNQLEFVFLDKGYDPFVANNAATFSWNADPDWDGLTTQVEFITHLTNPRQYDTELDGMNDKWEIAYSFNARLNNANAGPAAHHPLADPDGDGLNNQEESAHGTNPNMADTDGDGIGDGDEIDQGSNPNDPNDSQAPPAGTETVNITFGDPSGSNSEKYRLQLSPLEGDSGGIRFRTNRQYGAPQTDTFRLPKGAKYKMELIHVSTNSEYRDTPKPDYDYELTVDEESSCVVVDDPAAIMGNHDEGDAFFAAGKDATLYVPLFRPKEVSFSNSTVGFLTSDDTSTTYDAPHWQDSNDDGDAEDTGERKYPIAYVRNTPPTIAGKIKVKPSGLTSVSGFTAKIKVTGPGNIKINETSATVGTDEIELPATASTGNFVNEIDYMNPMTLKWEVKIKDKNHFCEAGDTLNRTYVTLGVPTTTMRQETLFDLGCRNADGESTDAPTVAAIWSDFTDRNVTRIDLVQMKYWNPPMSSCQSLPLMLADSSGNGTCVAWADLLKKVVEAQGIAGASIIEVESSYRNDGTLSMDGGLTTRGLFLVKDWNFVGAGTAPAVCAPFTHTNVEVTDELGAEGQGNSNPPGAFFNHFIVLYAGKYYDPSYGTGPYGSQLAWESASLDGYRRAINPGGGAPSIIANKPEDNTAIETIFTPTP